MFGRESKPCMVFEYGCRLPIAGEEFALDQMRKRNALWNKLVEIEREYRAKVRELLSAPEDLTPALVDELAKVREEIKAARKKERKGSVDVSALQARAKVLQAQLKEARAELKEFRKQAAQANKDLLQALDKERIEKVKAAQKDSGLYWGNYNDVIVHYQVARVRAMREGTELKFHRFDGTGKVTIRYQQGLPVPQVFEYDTRLQIDPVPEAAWEHPQRSERRKLSRTRVRIRVGSEGRQPIWFELPMIMHRPLPPDGEIRSASIVRERVADRYRYKLVITVALSGNRREPIGRGEVGVDLGWRRVKDGLRVAYWCDSSGQYGQLVLPENVVQQFLKLDDLKSIRDNHFNDAKAVLSTWLANKQLPDWLKEETASVSQWRSQARMDTLVRKWRENRFSGDQEIYAYLEEWRKRDRHLWLWEANLRDQVQRHRREIYRIFAAQIASKYREVYMEKFNLRAVAKKPEPEDGTAGTLPMDRQRVIAAVSTLRLAIETACKRNGVDVVYVDPAMTTIKCHACGHVEKFNAAAQIMRTCPACGEVWDQDYNAALNLLYRAGSQIEAH